MSEHVHASDEDLLHALLAASPDTQPGVGECAQCTLRAEELRRFVVRVRELLDAEEARAGSSGPQLAERVLAQTTREDRSSHGAWRERRLWSNARRVAAACVLITIATVPVVAWLTRDIWRAHDDVKTADERPRTNLSPHVPLEHDTARTVEQPAADSSAVEVAAAAARAKELRALEARNLRGARVPLAGAFTRPTDALAQLLWARSKQLENGSLDGVLITVGDSFEPLQVALSVEILLDTWALTGERPSVLSDALAEFAAWSDRIHDELALLAWERAESYGAVDAIDQPQLAALRRSLRGSDRAIARGDRAPLDTAWFDALKSALATRPRDAQGVIDAWIDAGR